MKCESKVKNTLEAHDHGDCVAHVMREIESRATPPNLTPARKHVLEILLAEHRAIGAYEILEELRNSGHNAQPPVAYRALDYLRAQGLVHKIEHLNAYVACTHPHGDHEPSFLICTDCNTVAESLTPAKSTLKSEAKAAGFAVNHTVVEVIGTCAACQAS